MSTAEATGPGEPGRLTVWLRHNSPPLMVVGLVGVLIVAPLVRLAGSSVWDSLVFILFMALLVCAASLDVRHGRNLCERCISEVPLDPGPAIRRRLRTLRAWHSNWPRKALILYGVGGLATVIMAGRSGQFEPPAQWIRRIAGTAIIVSMVWVMIVHRRLELWCPYCRRGDDDEETPAPVPDPTGADRPTVPA